MMSRTVYAAPLVLMVGLLAACNPGEHSPDSELAPAFALTEARVIHGEDQLPVNLVFVAGEDDRLWTQLSDVQLSGGVRVSAYELVAGEVTDWGQLGNLTLTAELPLSPVTATDVTLLLEDGTSATFPIGTWNLQATTEPGEQVLRVADYIAAYPDTDFMEFTATNVSGHPIKVKSLDLGLGSLTVEHVTVNGQPLQDGGGVEVAPENEVTFVLELASSGKHDFFMTSPVVAMTGVGEGTTEESFDPSMLGFSDITGEEIAAFAQN